MTDKIIDAAAAQGLHAYAVREQPLVGWAVMKGVSDYPDEFIARLMTNGPTPYVLLADTLAGLRDQLPPDLVRIERQPADPPEVMETWLPEEARTCPAPTSPADTATLSHASTIPGMDRRRE
jgi:hypothetical protein